MMHINRTAKRSAPRKKANKYIIYISICTEYRLVFQIPNYISKNRPVCSQARSTAAKPPQYRTLENSKKRKGMYTNKKPMSRGIRK